LSWLRQILEKEKFTNRGDRAINVFTKLAEYRDKERPD
jgi:hypothetical protein